MRMRTVWALVPLVAGCVIFSSDEGDVQMELDTNRGKWEVAAIQDYRMSFQRICFFCSVELSLPVRVTVREDEITEILDQETGEPLENEFNLAFFTINEIFDFIQESIDSNAVEIAIRYDSQLGYPTDVEIDLSRTMIRDDAKFQVRDFEELN